MWDLVSETIMATIMITNKLFSIDMTQTLSGIHREVNDLVQ